MDRYRVPFVLASTVHGPVILNAIEWHAMSKDHVEVGVGLGLLLNGEYDLALVSMTVGAIEARRRTHGPGAIALDCGANIGIYSMEWARAMEGWGSVLAFEPQERVFYALAGNLALNNLFNVRALNQAVGATCGVVDMPAPDYCAPNHFGTVSLKAGVGACQGAPKIPVEVISIDTLNLPRVDFIKLDIEGMELEALEGARNTIERSRPFILCEWHIAGKGPIEKFMQSVGFQTAVVGMNMFAGPPSDTMSRFIQLSKETEAFNVRSGKQDLRAGAAVSQGA
jgi:FkbM family methyltransferase